MKKYVVFRDVHRRSAIVAGVIFFLLLIPLFSAAGTASVSVTAEKDHIRPSETAIFRLAIKNTANFEQTYKLISYDRDWNVDFSPASDRQVSLGPGQSHTIMVKVSVSPAAVLLPNSYAPILIVNSNSGEEKVELPITLWPETPQDYLPVVKVSIDMNDKIVPLNPVSIKLFLENKNPLNLANLTVRLQSEMPEFNQELTVDLPPRGKKTVEFSVIPSEIQQPKEYTLVFVLEKEGQVVKGFNRNVEVIPVVSDFAVSVRQETIFLKHFYELSFTNKGNVLNTQEVKYPTTLWASLFTQGEGRTIVEEKQRYLAWQLTLAPGETATVSFVVNFRLLFYLLVFVLIVGLLYWKVRSPVALTKKAATTLHEGEGALSEIKITLELENRSSTPLKEVTVTDIVPAIVNVERSLDLGTLRPKEITHTKHGTKVTWSLVELDAHEHRIITYKVRAKLNILGTFSLPRAVVEYGKGKRRKGKAYSNVFKLGVE
ncbi:hypothetical protein HY496_02405 [Candidatus Woesearchaeota archaeon]|nr:hypothetical protein [Candidatus Woesearchaeota archaeon]